MYFTYHCNQLIYKIQLGKMSRAHQTACRMQAIRHETLSGFLQTSDRKPLRLPFRLKEFRTSACFPVSPHTKMSGAHGRQELPCNSRVGMSPIGSYVGGLTSKGQVGVLLGEHRGWILRMAALIKGRLSDNQTSDFRRSTQTCFPVHKRQIGGKKGDAEYFYNGYI